MHFSLNPGSLTFACSLKIKSLCIGNLILLMFLILKEVLTLLPFESSGYQC
jgi:hypothetical protein